MRFHKVIISLGAVIFLLSACNNGTSVQVPADQNLVDKTPKNVYYGPLNIGKLESGAAIGSSQAMDTVNNIAYIVTSEPNSTTNNYLHVYSATEISNSNIALQQLTTEDLPGINNSSSYQVPSRTDAVVDLNGNLYVAYYIPTSGTIFVNKYSKTTTNKYTYTQIGYVQAELNATRQNGHAGQFFKLAVDNGGNLYMAYVDDVGKVAVTILNSSGVFVPLGQVTGMNGYNPFGNEITAGGSDFVSMVIDNNIPVVAYQKPSDSNKLYLKILPTASGNWADANGSTHGISTGEAKDIKLAVDQKGGLVIVYQDVANANDISVQYASQGSNGQPSSPVVIGSKILGEAASYINLAIHPNNTIFISYATSNGVGVIKNYTPLNSDWATIVKDIGKNSTINQDTLLSFFANGDFLLGYHFLNLGMHYAISKTISSTSTSKFVFTTTNSYSGNMGGFTGADSICNQEAFNSFGYKYSPNGVVNKWHAMLWQNPNYVLNPNDNYYSFVNGNLITGPWTAIHPDHPHNEYLGGNNSLLHEIVQGIMANNGSTQVWTGWSDYGPDSWGSSLSPGFGNSTVYSTAGLGQSGIGSSWSCSNWSSESSIVSGAIGTYGMINGYIGDLEDLLRSSVVPTSEQYWSGVINIATPSTPGDNNGALNAVTGSCNNQYLLYCVGPYNN